MAFADITDPNAVRSAIAEFDELGRDAFLDRYRFGRSREYFLIHEGRRYDSKAILGAAHGYQFPALRALGPHDFSGGETQTVPKLHDLGFTVIRLSGNRQVEQVPERRCWAFIANPATYDVDAALAANSIESWSSKGKPLKTGDGVLLWRSAGRGGRRGIVAIGEVIGEPYVSSDEDDPFWHDTNAAAVEEPRVPIRFYDAPGLPLWIDSDHADFIHSLSAARARGGTVFHIEPHQWEMVLGLAGVRGDGTAELIEEIANPLRRRGGQGRGLSAAERRAVELRAMDVAEAYYRQYWTDVENVSASRSYDLECRSGNRFLRVEVKGTTGAGASVIVTINEVEHARANAPHVALFVVSGIRLDRDGPNPVASGGTSRVFEPWHVEDFELKPIAFECVVPPP